MSLWSCMTCCKSFTRKGDLTRHELLHTGIKPHVCKTCGKCFAQHSALKTHWNVHTKYKPYICGIGTCKKAFGDPSSCSRHRKETHRREGAYKCVVTDCGTRIKRRSAFVAHLRKHGLDPTSIDINAIVLRNNERGASVPTHFTSPDVENSCRPSIQSRSLSPSSLSDSSGYDALADSSEASHFIDGWLGDHPLDCRQIGMSPGHNTLLPMLDQVVNVGSGISQGDYTYSSNDFDHSFLFDGIFATTDNPSLITSPLNPPTAEPFIDDESHSWSSPSSIYSALLKDDVVSLSLLNNASQESLMYNM